MEFHQGRLIDHVHLRVQDLAVSKRFYLAVLGALGSGRYAQHVPVQTVRSRCAPRSASSASSRFIA